MFMASRKLEPGPSIDDHVNLAVIHPPILGDVHQGLVQSKFLQVSPASVMQLNEQVE